MWFSAKSTSAIFGFFCQPRAYVDHLLTSAGGWLQLLQGACWLRAADAARGGSGGSRMRFDFEREKRLRCLPVCVSELESIMAYAIHEYAQ